MKRENQKIKFREAESIFDLVDIGRDAMKSNLVKILWLTEGSAGYRLFTDFPKIDERGHADTVANDSIILSRTNKNVPMKLGYEIANAISSKIYWQVYTKKGYYDGPNETTCIGEYATVPLHNGDECEKRIPMGIDLFCLKLPKEFQSRITAFGLKEITSNHSYKISRGN